METELVEIMYFLGGHQPFSQLPEEALRRLPARLTIRYLRRGNAFPPSDNGREYLYIVRKGAIELRGAGGELVDKLGEGDLCSFRCIPGHAGRDLAVTTVEDTLLYCLDCAALAELRAQYPAFDQFFNQSLNARLRLALERLQASPLSQRSLLTVQVGELVQRAPVHAEPTLSIQDASQLMSEQGVSCLLVMQRGQLLGLVTDRDLRSRCLATGVVPTQPLSRIMTASPLTIERSAAAFEALMLMTQRHIHHLPVTERGRVVGVITATDLAQQQSASTVYLGGMIRKAETRDALIETSRLLPDVHLQMASAGAGMLGRSISALLDAFTQRLLVLAEADLGPPPVAYTWLGCGSQARQESTIGSDQDNALLLADDYRTEHAGYFATLARRVNDGLNDCGMVHCPGEVMASTEKWRQPLAQWHRYFDGWIDQPDRHALMHASIFFDMRVVHGSTELFAGLRDHVLTRARANSIFLASLASNALQFRPPLGFFRDFVLIHGGEHARTLDIKHGGILPIVDLARIHALAAGCAVVSTVERLQAACAAGELSQDAAEGLAAAFEFIGSLRARLQAQQIKSGIKAGSFINPAELSRLERLQLKDAFALIALLQKSLAQRYQTDRFM